MTTQVNAIGTTQEASNWDSSLKVIGLGEFLKMNLNDPTWLVEGLIPEPSTTILYGPGGARKSWFAQSMAIALASGEDFLGKFQVSKQRRVLYVQSESSTRGLRDRLLKLARGYGVTSEDLDRYSGIITNQEIDLSDDGFEQLTSVLEKARGEGRPFEFMVIDPLVDFHTADENDNGEMSRVVTGFRKLRDHYELNSLILHHTNKSNFYTGSNKARGASSIITSMDGRWSVRTGTGGWSSIDSLFLKEHEAAKPFQFRIHDLGDAVRLEYRPGAQKSIDKQSQENGYKEQIVEFVRKNGEIDRKQAKELIGRGQSMANSLLEEMSSGDRPKLQSDYELHGRTWKYVYRLKK